jgi:amidohydrolase
MIKEGCLKDISEVYGFHNIPNFDEGDIRVVEGPIFAEYTGVNIKITGQGGHGSTPHKLRDPITAAAQVITCLNTIKSRSIDSRKNIVFTLCKFQSGSTFNVYPDSAFLNGSIRSYDQDSLDTMKKRIK